MPVMNFLTRCIFYPGAIQKLNTTIQGLGAARPFLVTDKGIRAAGLFDIALEVLALPPAAIFDDTEANPTEVQARHAASLYQQSGADSLIALGGGSSMDLAKTIGLLVTHDAPLVTYAATAGGARKIGKTPPLIAIPTTAGTGSEVSAGLICTLTSGQKETIVSPNLLPDTAICDPDLTLGLPPHLTAATGMDAVTHCIEAILAPVSNPPAEGIGYDGLTRAVGGGALRRAVEDGADKAARWHMMMASYQGALAFVKGLGGVHALSHAAGRLHEKRLHHGTLNAVFLPHILRFNRGEAEEKCARLRFAMGLKQGADLAEAIDQLNADLGVPSTLSEIGLSAEDGPGIVEHALKDLAHVGNVKPMGAADYEQIFAAALG